MLISIFPKLNSNIFITIIKKGINSIWMMIAIILFAALSNIFGLEMLAYYVYMSLVIVISLFSDDMLAAIPMAVVSYMTFSKENNPLAKTQTSIFWNQHVLIQLIIIAIIISIFLVTRLIYDLVKNKERRTLPKLLYGYIALGLVYILGGLFSPYYNAKTAFFGLIQIISISATYFYFYYTVDWKKVNKDYFPLLFTMVGVLMVLEISNMLIDAGILDLTGKFSRGLLYTGWGHYNNIASVCILTIPAPFYFAITKKNGWIYLLIGSIFMLFVILNQSRNGILMSSIIYLICLITTLIYSSYKERLKHICCISLLLILSILTMIIFKEKMANIFASLLKAGTNDSGRFNIYIEGFKQYLDYPILGNGFYECNVKRWGIPYNGGFLPGRYHNTYIQLLACSGTIGILAYLYHRYQTIKTIIKNPNKGNLIIAITLLGVILISILDCHFFNFGPGLLYGVILLFSEKLYSN